MVYCNHPPAAFDWSYAVVYQPLAQCLSVFYLQVGCVVHKIRQRSGFERLGVDVHINRYLPAELAACRHLPAEFAARLISQSGAPEF